MSSTTGSGSVVRAGLAALAGLGVYLFGMLLTVLLAGTFAEDFLSLGDGGRGVVIIVAFTAAAGAAAFTTGLLLRPAGTTERTDLVLVALWPALFGVAGLFDGRAEGEPGWQGPVLLLAGVAVALAMGRWARRR